MLAFAGATLLITLGGAWGVSLLGAEPRMVRAVWISAVIALAVQLVTFAAARPFLATNPIAGWGIGSLIRFGVLALHAVVGVKMLGLESGPALLSLVAFLFVTMLVEPLFLKS